MKKQILGILSILCISLLCWGCSEQTEPDIQIHSEKIDPNGYTKIEKKSELGPVSAEVIFSPKEPELGQSVTLTLLVTAKPGAEVEMPDFGDQLGRFGIADFKPDKEVLKNGTVRYSQVYTLDLPNSGKIRVPSMLIEFKDLRDKHKADEHELLTEDFTVNVKSLVATASVGNQLRPAKAALAPLYLAKAGALHYKIILSIIFLALILGGLGIWFATRRRKVPAISPYERAIKELSLLSEIPEQREDLDAWFVKLSATVRRYIEDCYQVKAPKLTTEEFFDILSRQCPFQDDQKRIIQDVLSHSDRVKFAHYVPRRDESEQALDSTKNFVEQTHKAISDEQEVRA